MEKKEPEKANGPPAAGQSGEVDRQKEASHDHGAASTDGEKSHEHDGSSGPMGHMGLDVRSPWAWVTGGAMAVMMLLML